MRKITLIGGIAIVAISLTFLSSCKKEEITSKRSITQLENHGIKMPDFNFSTSIKLYGEKAEDGFLTLKVSSDDEAFLKKYVAKFQNSKVLFKEADPSKQERPASIPEEESGSSISLDFDWSNYHFNLEKGKMYGLCMKNENKSLVYLVSFTNITAFSTSAGYACVNIYNTYDKRRWGNPVKSRWAYLSAANSIFYVSNPLLSYQDNLEIRTCLLGDPLRSFYVGSLKINYGVRLNFSGDLVPSVSTDYNGIQSGSGEDAVTNVQEVRATATFYRAG